MCLPLVILAVLSIGYFMRIDGLWENCIHGAVDETALAASKAYDARFPAVPASKVKNRLMEDNPELEQVSIRNRRIRYNDRYLDDVTSYSISASSTLSLPLGFSREFTLEAAIKYRDFIGKKEASSPLGTAGLERDAAQDPVWVFPHAGEKYHGETCSYVKASAALAVLTQSLRQRYESCGLCDSEELPAGSLVFCFSGEDTAYHRGTCGTIVRHVVTMDKTEAADRGYTPCSKCKGG